MGDRQPQASLNEEFLERRLETALFVSIMHSSTEA